MKNDSNYKSTKKKKGKNLVRSTTFEVVPNGNGPLDTHLLSHTLSLSFAYSLTLSLSLTLYLSFSISLSFSLSLCFYPSHIFIFVPGPFTLISRTRLMSAHSRLDWVKTSARGDSSGSMRSNNAAAENIHSRRRLLTP